MDSKSIIGIIAVIIVIVILGYLLYYRSAGKGNNGNINPPAYQQQQVTSPNNSNQSPSNVIQPNQPTNLQDQGTTAPTGPAGGQIPLNSNSNTNDNSNPGMNAPAQAIDVTIKNMAFNPAQITVSAGTTVRWTNQDSITHTVTADNGQFSSGNLTSGDSYQFTFTTPGTYAYHCSIHPNMKGTVVVK